jgi:hypothetical protein
MCSGTFYAANSSASEMVAKHFPEGGIHTGLLYLGSGLTLAVFLPDVSIHINEPVDNDQVS